MESELVFRALGDANRRRILDLLHARDGRSLTEIETEFEMTRFGVMKHLRVLARAGLVVTRKSGRETLHYLNSIPIQQVYDRWVNKYAAPWASSLTELKYDLESKEMNDSNTTRQVFVIYIRTSPEKLWQAITDGNVTSKYYFGSTVEADWKVGAVCRYLAPDGTVLIEGMISECEPEKILTMTFNPKWVGVPTDYPETEVSFLIEEDSGVCKLTLIHSGLVPDHPLTGEMAEGWARIMSGLKTLLETGSPLAT